MLVQKPEVFVTASTTVDLALIHKWAEFYGIHDSAQVERMVDTYSAGELSDIDFLIELAGRHCYRSWQVGRNDSKEYIHNLLQTGHGSVLEHGSMTFFIGGISRSCSHELVRHRVGTAFSQESQRYVDADAIRFVKPPFFDEAAATNLESSCEVARIIYKKIKAELQSSSNESTRKQLNEAARSVLPNASETRIVVTMNVRSFRHFLRLRASVAADNEIRLLALAMFNAVENFRIAPFSFQDIVQDTEAGKHVLRLTLPA